MDTRPRTVLVVDDDATVLAVATRLLGAEGLETLTATTTAQALAAVAAGGVDAALVDVVLGQENGWEALRLILETRPLRVAMMSGGDMGGESLKDALLLGAAAALQKPFDRAALRGCLRTLGVLR